MRILRKNGDPVKEAKAYPNLAPKTTLTAGDVFGFKGDSIDYSPENNYGDGSAKMRPDLLLEPLLIGRSISKAGLSALKGLLKKGQTRAKRVANAIAGESAKQAGEQAAQSTIMELLRSQ